LPVPLVPESAQLPVVSLVDKILAVKAADPQADTAVFERELDRLVYCLYNLTDDEVRVIESGVPLSKAEIEEGETTDEH
jgi:hypothetical protein